MPVDVMVRANKDEAFRATVAGFEHPSGNIEDELDQILKLSAARAGKFPTISGSQAPSGGSCCC